MDIIKKWTPMIESIYQFDKVERLAAECAEHHLMIENKFMMTALNNAQIGGNLLPLSMMVFSKINILDIDIEFIEEEFDTYYFDFEIKSKEENMISPELIEEYKGILVNKLTSFINKEILDNNTLQIHLLVSSISIIAEKTKSPKMILKSNIKFKKDNE